MSARGPLRPSLPGAGLALVLALPAPAGPGEGDEALIENSSFAGFVDRVLSSGGRMEMVDALLASHDVLPIGSQEAIHQLEAGIAREALGRELNRQFAVDTGRRTTFC